MLHNNLSIRVCYLAIQFFLKISFRTSHLGSEVVSVNTVNRDICIILKCRSSVDSFTLCHLWAVIPGCICSATTLAFTCLRSTAYLQAM